MSTKRKPASKTAAARPEPKSSVDSGPQPMDPGGPEPTSAPRSPNRQRSAYAITTLVSEVEQVFPGVRSEPSNYNGFNTATDVTFDLTSVSEDEVATLTTLLSMLDSDSRVARVDVEDGQALVSLHSNLRTQDLRDSFGVAQAHEVLSAKADE